MTSRRRPFEIGDRVEVIGAYSGYYRGSIPLTVSSSAVVVKVGEMQALIKLDWVHQGSPNDDMVREIYLHRLRLIESDPWSPDAEIMKAARRPAHRN
jgi:hypothetical protein